MIRRLLLALALLLPAPLAAQPGGLSLEEQLELWLDWFPGRYDSYSQTRAQSITDVPEEERNYRRHSVFRRVDLPAFGAITFYAEQRRWLADAPPEGEVYRQRIYEISLDEERQAIRLRVHVPKDQPSLLGAYSEPDLLANLTPDDTIVWPGCDLFWTFEGKHFIGRLDPGACRFDSPAYGQEIQLEEYLLLAKDQMHFADRGLSMDGEYLFGMRGDEPTIALRVRAFVCQAWETGEPVFRALVATHDQGGLIEAGSQLFRLWTRGGTLRLDLIGDGNETAVASKEASAGANSIRLAAMGTSVSCQHVPRYQFDF